MFRNPDVPIIMTPGGGSPEYPGNGSNDETCNASGCDDCTPPRLDLKMAMNCSQNAWFDETADPLISVYALSWGVVVRYSVDGGKSWEGLFAGHHDVGDLTGNIGELVTCTRSIEHPILGRVTGDFTQTITGPAELGAIVGESTCKITTENFGNFEGTQIMTMMYRDMMMYYTNHDDFKELH